MRIDERNESTIKMSDPSATELLDGFGLRLSAARIAAGYRTRKELADDIGVDQNTYSPWERGRSYPSAKTLLELRKILKVSLDWLMADDDRNLSVDVYRKINEAMPQAMEIRSGRRKSLD